jgi:cupin 2 domain-containing protein
MNIDIVTVSTECSQPQSRPLSLAASRRLREKSMLPKYATPFCLSRTFGSVVDNYRGTLKIFLPFSCWEAFLSVQRVVKKHRPKHLSRRTRLSGISRVFQGGKEARSAVDIGNVFSGLSREIPDELFEELAATEACTIERIISRGHSTPEGQWYDQERNEWVIVLKGRALLQFADSDQLVRMEEGDYINIPAHKRHRVAWTDPEEDTVWLAFHYT